MNLAETLKRQECSRNQYWEERDYFLPRRFKWRAQVVRHLFHLLPGDSILEIGGGSCEWTREISSAGRNNNPICSVTFDPECYKMIFTGDIPENIEPLLLDSFPGCLEGRQFDFIVGWHLLTDENYGALLYNVKKLLKPGGQFLFFERNPWNPYYMLRRLRYNIFPFLRRQEDETASINRLDMFTLLSEIGYTGIKILPYDFLYPPIPKFLLWPMQNLSLIFENFPYLRNFAGTMYVWAQKPAPENWTRKMSSLVYHDTFKQQISVVVPSRNEEVNISSFAENMKACYGDYIREIIFVDDNSTDGTAAVIGRLAREDPRIRLVRRDMPNGVGRALRDGLAAVSGRYVLMIDCDFQHILPELTGLFDAVAQGADVAIGSRFSRDSVLLNYAFTKIVANRGFHILANILLRKHFRDVTNNLKLMKREVADRLYIESDDFAANAETGLQPILLGYNVVEVPVSWINRSVDMGFSSFNLMNVGPNYIRILFRLMWRRWLGKEIVSNLLT